VGTNSLGWQVGTDNSGCGPVMDWPVENLGEE
jgi:hypothetical protein